MPRRDFQQDVAQACVPGTFPRLSDVRCGSEDGSISFIYTTPLTAKTIEILATVPDTSEYPKNHVYFAFTVNDKVPEAVPAILESTQPSFGGLSIHEFLEAISDCLDSATSGEDYRQDDLQEDVDYGDNLSVDDDPDWQMDDDDDDGISNSSFRNSDALREAIRSELCRAREAGYRVSCLSDPVGSVILSVSCRITKLGISDEAMQAWNVHPTEYLVLLIRYPHGYRSLSELIELATLGGVGLAQFHVGLCDFYKPSLTSARQAFVSGQQSSTPDTCPPLKPFFIEKSLRSLLNERFISILKCRLAYGFSWTGAELYVQEGQGRITSPHESVDDKYYIPERWDASSPVFLSADHLTDNITPPDMSLLLMSMQFTLRRFVKCTEFCLNCFCKINAGFEALKPFVCSNGLCLYQYLALGMGPNLEWEITTQPYVVDLLISFAYARAASRKLEDFPNGLQLKVPNPSMKDAKTGIYDATLTIPGSDYAWLKITGAPEIRCGDWVAMVRPQSFSQDLTCLELHACVRDISNWPRVQLSKPIPTGRLFLGGEDYFKTPFEGEVIFILYDTNFDDLSDINKNEVLSPLLDTLPTVAKMKSYIESEDGGCLNNLASWTDAISPSALNILQWIVGSNRSCILYDDNPEDQVSGMDSYLQFRLTQGAPDKEQRFVAAVTCNSARRDLKHPTIFAWHGSPLQNWHSILREGLHYRSVAHGRSFGNGIYLSYDFFTSMSFSANGVGYVNQLWPQSALKCSSAISLNEVVNSPDEFVSTAPHYVVQHLDWVQPRYLFIESKSRESKIVASAQEVVDIYAQDPAYTAIGPNKSPITVPMSALTSRVRHSRPKAGTSEPAKPRSKRDLLMKFLTEQCLGLNKNADNDDTESVITLIEDREFLISGYTERLEQHTTNLDGSQSRTASLTDFQPGTLQASSIQLLGPPAYASPAATKILRSQLRTVMELQKTQPLHELGWFIDPNLTNNLYQWIVEFHSFDPQLQLALDLKSAGLTSVVMEIRYPPQFPLTPPFVRIIRPRFLRYSLGGGGHITAGGSLCMELLTNSGWSAVASIESVLLQVRMAITNPYPQPARLDSQWKSDYTVAEALSEYKRVCHAHGWAIPDDINLLTWT